MKILYLVPYAPNQIRVRPYNLIRSLAARGNAVTVFTLVENELDRQSVRALSAEGITVRAFDLPRWRTVANTLRAAFTRNPLQSYYCWHSGLAEQALQTAAAGFDVIHVEHLRGARFADYLKQRQSRPVIWDSVDSISYLFQQTARQSKKRLARLIAAFEKPRTARYEGRMAAQFERTLVTSATDRQALIELLPASANPARIDVIPNGVDLDYFQPGPDVERDAATLVVSGKMSYHANVSMTLHLVQNILPLIWAKKPQVRLSVVGKDPPVEIRALAADPRIEVSGYVADIRPYLLKAVVAAAPLTYGAGIQNKVLEAMACGLPVVTTPLAARNLSARDGQDLLVAQEPAAFAQTVLDLLDHPERRAAVGQAGRRYVERCHNWDTIANQLEHIYRSAIADHAAVT